MRSRDASGYAHGARRVGKTRLAIEVARDASGLFPVGAIFVALAPLSDSDLVVPTVARSLGLKEAAGQTLRKYLRDKRLLLVLDNFEHLTGAAPEVVGLIEHCPDLVVLVTSESPLRVRGERDYPVGPLALPAFTRSPVPDEVAGSPSGRLFLERARAVSPAFDLTAANVGAVASICWRMDGLPLDLAPFCWFLSHPLRGLPGHHRTARFTGPEADVCRCLRRAEA